MRRRLITLGLVLLTGCGGDDSESAGEQPRMQVTAAPEGAPWQRLSEWHLFSDLAKGQPAERVMAYQVLSPLWSDDTVKRRYLYLPAGETIGFRASGRWQFPRGTILVKTFAYPVDARDESLGLRLLETRLLVREAAGWKAHTYVYGDDPTDAVRTSAGKDIAVSYVDTEGMTRTVNYGVPNTNQCNECHGEVPDTLGGKTKQLDLPLIDGQGNQIDELFARGWLDQEPPPADQRVALVDPAGSAPVAERARSYLDANCSHCHEAGGSASQSGLKLAFEETGEGAAPVDFGVCKVPTSAGGATCGLTHDIVPGKPEASILICRTESRDPQVQMPPLATRLAHASGVALLSEWIAGLPGGDCQSN